MTERILIRTLVDGPPARVTVRPQGAVTAAGESAYQIWLRQPGNAGKTEAQFLASLVGPQGAGIRVLGTLDEVGDLPASGADTGDGYIIDQHLWLWDGATWNDAGAIGVAGESAYQIAFRLGLTTAETEAEWIDEITPTILEPDMILGPHVTDVTATTDLIGGQHVTDLT